MTRSRFAFLAAALLALLNLLTTCGCGNRPGAGWTHKELLEHLESRGLKVEVVERVSFGINGPYVRCRLDGHRGRTADITLTGSDAEAREKAAVEGGEAFAWGRFLFDGEPEQLKKIRAAINPAR